MSVLDNNSQPKLSTPEKIANQIKAETKSAFRDMVNAFNNGAKLFWTNSRSTPQEIATALGSEAKEIFELHGKLGALIASIKPEAISEGSGVVGSFTINNDNTVTIN
jgi:hypothetical protein